MGNGLLSVQGLSVMLDGQYVLKSIDFEVAPGEAFGVLGENGSGKTTLLNAISRYVNCCSGRINFKNCDVTRYDPARLASMGMVRAFQVTALIDSLTIEENLRLFGLRRIRLLARDILCGVKQEAQIEHIVKEATARLTSLGLGSRSEEKAGTLSAGQRKIVSLVGSLATQGDLLLLDEPTASLSSEFKVWLHNQLQLERRAGRALVIVEHDDAFTNSLCNRIVRIEAGRFRDEV